MKSFKLEDRPIQPMTQNQLKFWLMVEAGLVVFFGWSLWDSIRLDASVWQIILYVVLVGISVNMLTKFYKQLKGGVYRDGRKSK